MPIRPVTRRAALAAALALPLAARAQPKAAAMTSTQSPWPLIELRRYRTNPGKRDTLIALFEQQFVESQDDVGMTVIGTFREPGFDDRFTWVRGFADMAARGKALNDFYYGPIWQAHRNAANDCLFDNDDVWLLREAAPGSGFTRPAGTRPPTDAVLTARTPVSVHIRPLTGPAAEGPAHEALIKTAPTGLIAAYVREKAANNFPRLPVHEDREVLVWFQSGLTDVPSQETLHLVPTARSWLTG